MKITELKKNTNSYDIFVEFDQKEWHEEQDKVTKNLAKNINVAGFRKGHVPFDVAVKRINPQEIMTRAVDKVLKRAANEIIESEEFKKIEDDVLDLPPKVDVISLTKDEIKFKFAYTLFPEVNVDGYKDIKLETKQKEITDKEIDEEVNKYLERNSMTIPKESGAILKGDIVTFDFKGFTNGKPFEGGEAKNYELTIGSGQFIPGFEDQMIGMNIGDKKDINVTFPTDYHQKSLAGQPAKFEVLIHSISQVKKSKLDDEFVKSLSINNVETVEQLKNHIKTNLELQSKNNFEQERKQEIYKKILEITKISDIPNELVEKETEKLMKNTERQMSMYGIKIDQYLSMLNINQNQWKEQQKEMAIQNLKTSMALLKICELENIEANEKEIEEELEKAASQYKMNKDEIKKNLNNNLSVFESLVIEKKVMDFFINKK